MSFTFEQHKGTAVRFAEDFYLTSEWTAFDAFRNMEEEDYTPDSQYADYLRELSREAVDYSEKIGKDHKQDLLDLSQLMKDCADTLSPDTDYDPASLVMSFHIMLGNDTQTRLLNAENSKEVRNILDEMTDRMGNPETKSFEFQYDDDIRDLTTRLSDMYNTFSIVPGLGQKKTEKIKDGFER